MGAAKNEVNGVETTVQFGESLKGAFLSLPSIQTATLHDLVSRDLSSVGKFVSFKISQPEPISATASKHRESSQRRSVKLMTGFTPGLKMSQETQ